MGTNNRTAPAPEKSELESTDKKDDMPRYPRSLQALQLQPLRREVEYGVPSCDLQLRSYSARPLEFYCDFALRAAYYLGLPAFGPVPLPKIIERWTVPRSHFIFKKSQENYERITLRRLIQIRDGHPETVQIWLSFLQKHATPGIGMKANMWEFGALGKLYFLRLPMGCSRGVTLTRFSPSRCWQGAGRDGQGCVRRSRRQVGTPGTVQTIGSYPEGSERYPCQGESADCRREIAETAYS